ncbi:hypothetical protein HZH68_013208 [Vespula germanica]|uniref:Uncharacterized protein n=1 Tax=Vespula germanica TaxID=30212 RepID=A0A834JFK0_VESGE|nr:hypothetical protein HZH68_013208 [Vespula germanica]
MTLPISSYEKLLDQVRELTHETRLLQRDLHSALYNANIPADVNHNFNYERRDCKKEWKLYTIAFTSGLMAPNIVLDASLLFQRSEKTSVIVSFHLLRKAAAAISDFVHDFYRIWRVSTIFDQATSPVDFWPREATSTID